MLWFLHRDFRVVFRVVLLKVGRCSRIFHFLSSLLLHTKLVSTFVGGREEGVGWGKAVESMISEPVSVLISLNRFSLFCQR